MKGEYVMSKIAVIYWSGTGNTEEMAKNIFKGIAGKVAEAEILEVSDISAAVAAGYEKLALGCPAMGMEELEDEEFEPFFAELESMLNGKKIALFGSYGWGDGEWMDTWQERVRQTGAFLYRDKGLIINEAPDGNELLQCEEFGRGFAEF